MNKTWIAFVGFVLGVTSMLADEAYQAAAQGRPKALTGVMTVTVNGLAVTLTDAEKTEIAQRVPAVAAALPPGDQASVSWQAALTAEQRAIVDTDPPEQWTPEVLAARWKAGGAVSMSRSRAAQELEIAIVAQRFLAR